MKNKNVLILSHNFTNTGGPRAILELAKIFKNNGWKPLVVGFGHGSELREEFKANGIKAIKIKKYLIPLLTFISKFFNLTIANTITMGKEVLYLSKHSKTPLVWWIHEAGLIENLNKKEKILFEKALNSCSEVYAVSDYAKTFIDKYRKDVKVLNFGIQDEYQRFSNIEKVKNDKIKLLMVGDIGKIKGQDIAIKAFLRLPEEYREKCDFDFIGDFGDLEYKNIIENLVGNTENIHFLGKKVRNEALTILNNTDIVLFTSRGDSYSIAGIEALMLNKPLIISNNTGISNVIKKYLPQMVYEDENNLVEILEKTIDTFELSLDTRKIYLENFSLESFNDFVVKEFIENQKY